MPTRMILTACTIRGVELMARRKNTPPKLRVMSALDLVAHNAGMSHSDLAAACDVSKQAMHRRFEQRRNISVGVAAQIAEATGYELALVPRGADYPEGSLRIEAALADKHALGGRR